MPEIGKSLTDIDLLASKIKTGTYTGDGTTSQAISGVGFRPKYVLISRVYTVDQSGVVEAWITNQMGAFIHHIYDHSHYVRDHRIDSLDADGFTVDDDGVDADPNKLNINYAYICFG